MYDYFFPEKTVKFCQSDKPWVTHELRQLDPKRRRAWVKNKHSDTYKDLNSKYLDLCKSSKSKFYDKSVSQLKTSNISSWYKKVKIMSGQSQSHGHGQNLDIDAFKGISTQEQCEKLPISLPKFPTYMNL